MHSCRRRRRDRSGQLEGLDLTSRRTCETSVPEQDDCPSLQGQRMEQMFAAPCFLAWLCRIPRRRRLTGTGCCPRHPGCRDLFRGDSGRRRRRRDPCRSQEAPWRGSCPAGHEDAVRRYPGHARIRRSIADATARKAGHGSRVQREIFRIKAVLVLKRNAERDYVDFAALGTKMPARSGIGAMRGFDELHPQPAGESALQQLLAQLSDAGPYDKSLLEKVRYNPLQGYLSNWMGIRSACRAVAGRHSGDSPKSKFLSRTPFRIRTGEGRKPGILTHCPCISPQNAKMPDLSPISRRAG